MIKQRFTFTPWILEHTSSDALEYKQDAARNTLSNGRLGVKGYIEEAGHRYLDALFCEGSTGDNRRGGDIMVSMPDGVPVIIEADGVLLDPFAAGVRCVTRLDMQQGVLRRLTVYPLSDGRELTLQCERFVSLVEPDAFCLRMRFSVNRGSVALVVSPAMSYADDLKQYDEPKVGQREGFGVFTAGIKGRQQIFSAAFASRCAVGGVAVHQQMLHNEAAEMLQHAYTITLNAGAELYLEKYYLLITSAAHKVSSYPDAVCSMMQNLCDKGYEALLREHVEAWEDRWQWCDIVVGGDDYMQHSVRYALFMLMQHAGTPQCLGMPVGCGATGTASAMVQNWSFDAFVMPFLSGSYHPGVARQYIVRRFDALDEAMQRARKGMMQDGGALFPAALLLNKECSSDWMARDFSVFRNAMVAWSLSDYVQQCGDREVLASHGFKLLIGIARYWCERIHFSDARNRFVLPRVVGPDTYSGVVDNDWFTNLMAAWSMEYALAVKEVVKVAYPEQYQTVCHETGFDEDIEGEEWMFRTKGLAMPAMPHAGVMAQHDGFADLEQYTVDDLEPHDIPLDENWSADFLWRSGFVSQPSVLLGMMMLPGRFNQQTLSANYQYYQQRTVHRTPWSHAVHAIITSRMADSTQMLFHMRHALGWYHQHDAFDGISMAWAGSVWMMMVRGVAGISVSGDRLIIEPVLPAQITSLAFQYRFRERLIKVSITSKQCTLTNFGTTPVDLLHHKKHLQLLPDEQVVLPVQS